MKRAISLTATLLVLSLVSLVLLILAPQQSHAQASNNNNNIVATAPNDTKLIDSKQIIQQLQTALFNSRLENYKLFANGTAEYTIQLLNLQGAPLRNQTMEIRTNHQYGADMGYIYNSTGVYTQKGDQKLVITTFD